MKKVIAWCSVIALLAATTLSPMVNVFAAKNASDAKASGQYDELLEVYYWLQEAETCIMGSNSSHIKNSKNLFLAGGDESAETNKAEAINYYNLHFTFDTTKLYDGYLEAVGQGSYKNGSVYCNQLGYQPLVNLMIKYELYYTDKVADLVCGKNDEGGLFKIKLSNDYRGWGNKAGWWPSGWPEPDSYGYIPNSECHSTFDKIRYYATSGSGAQIDSGNKSNPVFYAGFERNEDFNLTNYFKEYTGDLSSVKSGLLTARRYANFVNACKTVQRTKADYDTAKANGAGNYYRIYHNGATEYFTLEEPNRKLYINDSLTDSTSTTCQAVAEALSPGSNEVKAVSDAAKLTDINSCYDTAQDNIEKLKEVQIDVQKIYDTGVRLLRGAKALRDELNYNDFRFDFGNGYAELMRAWARPAGGGDDLDYFIQITEDFENVVKEYHYKTNGGTLTQEEIDDLNSRIDNYEINLEEFKSSVQDAVDNKMNELPKLSLADISVYSGGNGYIKNSVDGFYEINTETGVLTCTANNAIERIRGEIMGVTGGSIGFTAYEEVTRDENDTDVAGVTGTSGSQDSEAVCKKNSSVLGWILCPIIKSISGIGQWMWENVVENLLQVPTQEVFKSGGGVEKVWGSIRDIANVVFVILFMVVIFSQLTGVGIDNYGIKKILPRLIITAILMNLSWVICELAVDASNIAGVGVKDMFVNFASGVTTSDSTLTTVGGLALDIGLGGGAFAIFALLNPGGAAMAAATVGLGVLGIVISMVFAIVVLYLTLVIREAAVVLVVVLAPIAIVCYTLPNTEKLFKRWLDLMKAILVAYPICALALGAGRLASATLGSITSNSGMQLAAMVVQVLPFFFIPVVLKNSLAGLGNIGAKLSAAGKSIGRRTSGALTGGIRNSAKFKDFEQFQKDKTTAERAGRVAKALENRARKRGGVENLSARDQDRLAKAHAIQEQRKAYERRTEMGAREDYHEFREKNMDAAFDSERGKMYAQNFEFETNRDNIETAFNSAMDGDDAEYAVAAMEALINRGGIKEAMKAVQNKKDFDWDSAMGKRLAQAMGGTNVDAFQAYSKYRGKGGKVGFDDWLRGADHGKGPKDVSSYADHLRARGIKSMAKYSKDEMEFIKNNYSAISAGMGVAEREEFRGDLAGMVSWAAINSDDAKVSRMAEQVLTQELTYGTEDISGNKTYGISSVRDLGLTAGSIGQMKGTTMKAILSGYEQRIASNEQYASLGQEKITELATQALRNDLAPQIKAIESDFRIKNNTSGDVLSILGISGGPNDIPDTSVPLRQEAPTPKPNNNPASSSNDGWYFDNYGGGSKT